MDVVRIKKVVAFSNGVSKTKVVELQAEVVMGGAYVRLWDGDQPWWPPFTASEWAAVVVGKYTYMMPSVFKNDPGHTITFELLKHETGIGGA